MVATKMNEINVFEKPEIIRLVEQSHLPVKGRGQSSVQRPAKAAGDARSTTLLHRSSALHDRGRSQHGHVLLARKFEAIGDGVKIISPQ